MKNPTTLEVVSDVKEFEAKDLKNEIQNYLYSVKRRQAGFGNENIYIVKNNETGFVFKLRAKFNPMPFHSKMMDEGLRRIDAWNLSMKQYCVGMMFVARAKLMFTYFCLVIALGCFFIYPLYLFIKLVRK